MRDKSWLWGVGALAVCLILAFALGAANPLSAPHIKTDALGPDAGETTPAYLQRATTSLQADGAGAGDEQRWALVSFVTPATAAAAADAAGDVRISEALFYSPAAGAQSPVVTVATPAAADPAALLARAKTDAASQLDSDRSAAVGEDARAIAVADLRGECACVVGLVVRATPEQLRAIAQQPDVQAVEALPADAVFGRFAVRAFLPGSR